MLVDVGQYHGEMQESWPCIKHKEVLVREIVRCSQEYFSRGYVAPVDGGKILFGLRIFNENLSNISCGTYVAPVWYLFGTCLALV